MESNHPLLGALLSGLLLVRGATVLPITPVRATAPGAPALLSAGWNSLALGLNNTVNAIAVSGADVYVAGQFTDAGGIADADYIARWDGSAWHAVGAGLNNTVQSVAIHNGQVYVGGLFLNAGGDTTADRIAYWDGSAWKPLGNGLSATVWALASDGTNLYAGGDFQNAGGKASADYVAYWDGSAWQAMGSGTGNWVRGIAVSGSDVYVAGGFADLGGNPDADGVARWDGSGWHALGTGGMSFWAYDVYVYGTDVYVGGGFLDAGGNPNADYVARFDGSNWQALGNGASGPVYAVVADGSGVYVGGTFFNVGGNPSADYIARWTTSAGWEALGSGLTGTVRALCIAANNVFAGGDFLDGNNNDNIDFVGRWENTVLPVELGRFTVSPGRDGMQLHWHTYTEFQNSHFQIEHGTDGLVFNPVGTVPGIGNSTTPREYAFLHRHPLPGANFYRLRQVDFDGGAQLSPIVRADWTARPALVLLARPGANSAELSGPDGEVLQVRVFDAAGRLLYQQEGRGSILIDFSAFPAGIYAIQGQAGQVVESFLFWKE